MWNGSEGAVPSGWYLCDGTNDTPDLRNRFIIGVGGKYKLGDTGGAETVTLTVATMPSHSHNVMMRQGDKGDWNSGEGNTNWGEKRTDSITSGATGGGLAHENMPPYYALCYIMRA